MRVKLFVDNSRKRMEEQLNAWLADNPNTIIYHVKQSESGDCDCWSMTISIWYKEEA